MSFNSMCFSLGFFGFVWFPVALSLVPYLSIHFGQLFSKGLSTEYQGAIGRYPEIWVCFQEIFHPED